MESNGKKLRTFSIRMEEELFAIVERIAKSETRSVGQQVVHFMKIGLDEYRREQGAAGKGAPKKGGSVTGAAV